MNNFNEIKIKQMFTLYLDPSRFQELSNEKFLLEQNDKVKNCYASGHG